MRCCELELGFVWLPGKLIAYSSGVIFTTLYYLPNLQMSQISYSVSLHQGGKAWKRQHSSLLGPFINVQDNEMF
jgi:hypothetical protein